jgi:hypothetical protein
MERMDPTASSNSESSRALTSSLVLVVLALVVFVGLVLLALRSG